MNIKFMRVLGYVIFYLGVILGLALAAIAVWNRTEAISYFFRGAKLEPFNGLRCPAFIAPTETAAITVDFKNPANEEDTFFYRIEVSGAPSTRRIADQITVPPHKTKSTQVTVDAKDVDLLFFIFTRINTSPGPLHSAQEAVCGMMVVNLMGLTGAQLSTIAICLSFLGMATGLSLWQRTITRAGATMQRLMPTIGLVVLLALLSGALGWWMAGMALLVIAILLMVISLRFAAV
jgi:hypothetical protein